MISGRVSMKDVFEVHNQVVGEILELGALMPQELTKIPLPFEFVLQRFRRRVIYAKTAERYLQELAKRGFVQYYDIEMHDYPKWLVKFFSENPPEEIVFLWPTSNLPPITILERTKFFVGAVFGERLTKDVVVRANVWSLTQFPLAEILSEQFERIIERILTRADIMKFYGKALEPDRSFYRFLQEAGIIDSSDRFPTIHVAPDDAVERVNQILLSKEKEVTQNE